MATSKTPITESPKPAHTLLPWELVPQNGAGPIIARKVETGNQMTPTRIRLVAQVFERGNSLKEDRANAEFIIRAVNCHQELLEACKLVIEWYENSGASDPDRQSLDSAALWSTCKKAIQKAESGS